MARKQGGPAEGCPLGNQQRFLAFAQGFCPLQPAAAAVLFAPFRPVPHQRQLVQQAGELLEDGFLLESGILCSYYLRPDSEEVTTNFFFRPLLLGDILACATAVRLPSK